MNLDPAVRAELASAIVAALGDALPGAEAGLRGSLARGCADPYSDIDVFWEVPDRLFDDAIDSLYDVMAGVGPVESLRSDPLLQNSEKRRLIFVQFVGVSLLWRVDIEVSAESIDRDPAYDLDNPDARGDEWSLPHSALMNAVAGLRGLLRGDLETADECVRRAFERIGEPVPERQIWECIEVLAEQVGRLDLEQAELVRRVQLLLRDARERVECPASHECGLARS